MTLRVAQEVYVDGTNVVPDVWEVLDKIKDFSGGCAAEWRGGLLGGC